MLHEYKTKCLPLCLETTETSWKSISHKHTSSGWPFNVIKTACTKFEHTLIDWCSISICWKIGKKQNFNKNRNHVIKSIVEYNVGWRRRASRRAQGSWYQRGPVAMDLKPYMDEALRGPGYSISGLLSGGSTSGDPLVSGLPSLLAPFTAAPSTLKLSKSPSETKS